MQQQHGPKVERNIVKLYKCPSIKVPIDDNENNLHYDPNQIPPDIGRQIQNYFKQQELAKKHQKAQAIGKLDQKVFDSRNSLQRCPCCNLPFEKLQIPLTEPVIELAFLGQGYPMYFCTIIYYVIYLIFLFIISGLYNVINIFQCNVEDEMCKKFLGIWYMSGKSKKIFLMQNVLNLLGVIFSCIFAYFIRIKNNEIAIQTDVKLLQLKAQESLTTPSDYTILMEGSNELTEQEIRDFFQKKMQQQGKEVISFRFPGINRIIFTVRVDQYSVWLDKIGQLKKDQEKIKKSTTEDTNVALETIAEEIQKIQNQIDFFLQNQKDVRCRYIFITFNSEQEARQMIKNCQPQRYKIFRTKEKISRQQEQRILKHYKVELKRAPEPFDIIWENLHYPYKEQLIRRIKTIAVAIGIIIVVKIYKNDFKGALIMYGLNWISEVEEINPQQDLGIAFLLSIPIQIANECLSKFLFDTIELQKHITHTNESMFNIQDLFDRWFTISVTITQFINTAIVPFILFKIGEAQSKSEEDQNKKHDNFLNGLFFLWLLDIIIIPLLLILDPSYIQKLRKRKQIEKLVTNPEKNQKYNQKDTHLIYEGPEFEISSIQATISSSILVAIFYINIFPFGIIFVLVTSVIVYWVSKYLLLRICSWPRPLSWELQQSIQYLMNFIPLILALGGILYEHSFNVQKIENIHIPIHTVNFCIGFLAIFLIPSIPLKQQKVQNDTTINFDEAKIFFFQDYDIENPISHIQAREIWLEKQQGLIQEQNQISEQNQLIISQPQRQYLNIYDYPEQFASELDRDRYYISSWQQRRMMYQEIPNQFIIQQGK